MTSLARDRHSLWATTLLLGYLAVGTACAQDALSSAVALTAFVDWQVGGEHVMSTGTLLAREDGKGMVFTVVPGRMTKLDSRSRAGLPPPAVWFHREGEMHQAETEVLAGPDERGWVLLQVAGDALPPAPDLLVETALVPGAPVVVGCYGNASFTPGATVVPSVLKGLVSKVEAAGAEDFPVPEISCQIMEFGIGGPVLDQQGRLHALTGPAVSGSLSKTIPLGQIWEFAGRKAMTLDFDRARRRSEGWRVACRIGLPLPPAVQPEVSLRWAVCPPESQSGRLPAPEQMAAMPWVPAKSDGGSYLALLPVLPPDQEQRLYLSQIRVRIAGQPPVEHPPSILLLTYARDHRQAEPWLRTGEAQP